MNPISKCNQHCIMNGPTNLIFPPKALTCNSNILSKKQQCISLLKLCSSTKHLFQIQAQIQVSGLHQDSFLLSEFVRFCSLYPSKNLSYAKSLLEKSVNSTPSSWSMLIRGYASSDSPKEAMWVFHKMRKRGIIPHNLTFPFLLKACAKFSGLEEGRQVLVEVVKYGLDCDVYVMTNLVHFYGSCKEILDACLVFDEMCERNLVSWNVVITACVDNLWWGDAIGYFVKMRNCGFDPDETTMVIVLSACVEFGNLSLGRWIHSQVIERGMILNFQLGTALVDMYAKCGAVNYAKLVFDAMEERDVWTWSAMILGLAQHGYAKEALELFSKMMKNSSIRPNCITFLGVICACCHAGLIDDGYRYFHDMEHVYGIKPNVIHYGAMVDVLGRAGLLKEAYDFIMNMPIEADQIVWTTLLSACSIHDVNDKAGVGKEVRKRLFELEPRRDGNFVMVANMYAEVGMWEKATNLRRVMRDGGLKKMAGGSWVELGGSIHKFFSGYDYQADRGEVYQLLEGLNLHMKMPKRPEGREQQLKN